MKDGGDHSVREDAFFVMLLQDLRFLSTLEFHTVQSYVEPLTVVFDHPLHGTRASSLADLCLMSLDILNASQ